MQTFCTINEIGQRSHHNRRGKVKYRKMRHAFFACLITLSGLYLSILGVLIVLPRYFSDEKMDRFQDAITREYYHHYRSEVADLGAANRVKRVYHGRVLIEFCERVLAGRISAQSNVLVVSPEIIHNGVHSEGTTSGFVHISHNGPAKSVLSIALRENHIVHALSPSADLNSWWKKEATPPATKPSWILLAYFVAQKNSFSLNSNDNSIDFVLHPDRVSALLRESTITYIVFHVQAHWDNNGVKMHGLTAIQTLIDASYKVQVLASSHYCTTEVISAENNKYGPNTLLKSSRELEEMFKSCYDRHYNPKDKVSLFVEVLLFATQGLDLAIPSRRSYLNLTRKTCPWQNNERCDLSIEYIDDILPTCPLQHSRVNIVFNDTVSAANTLVVYLDGEEALTITDDNFTSMTTRRSEAVRSSAINIKEIWLGYKDINRSEAACVALELIYNHEGIFGHKNSRKLPLISCVTRIVSTPSHTLTRHNDTMQVLHNRFPKKSFSKTKTNANILLILLDPMSRSQFRTSLPRTAKILTELGFIRFSNYTAVGDNSGPNQAALFTGKPLVNGREGIKTSTATNDGNRSFWLWDKLQTNGYVTLKAENGCISNSNMLQSIKPRTTHGQQLHKMYCFDFDRPNCLGKNLTAEYLANYATQFIDAYHSDEHRPNHPPWAAFLSFIDGHEDTLTLASLLDNVLLKFIHYTSKVTSNTVIVVLSDHGLHYGPYFRSIPGERERAEPLLYIRLPDFSPRQQRDTLKDNSKMFVTPFDVHETLMDISLQPATENSDIIGYSLLHPLSADRKTCRNTPGIPRRFCHSKEMHQPMGTLPTASCQFMPHPPSTVSFFSDIPRANRPIWPNCKLFPFKKPKNQQTKCYCATNERDWHECKKNFRMGINIPFTNSREHFHIVSCDGETENDLTVHINISRQEDVADRFYSSRKSSNDRNHFNDLNAHSTAPNILFIEVDSVSLMSAERLFPRTQQVLKRHKISVDSEGKLYCPKGVCSATFEKSSIVGRNSIPNQLAALSGCINQNFYNDENLYLHTKGKQGMFDTWCPTKNIAAESPWIFSIARDLGYVTFFGEEFCYNSSPYVIQNNIFPLDADVTLHEIFCLLAADTIRRKEFDINKDLWSVEHDWSSNPKPCLNGGYSRQQLAFDHIFQLWKQYEDIPKLAFLNALAAHDYSLDVAFQIIGAEAYDELLSSFLEKMIKQPDADNTIIIIRSDHGLQGGPSKVDYSTQIEHMNPWSNIIVPAKFPTLSITSLEANQKRLVTGFDLYRTLRNLITLKQPRTPEGIPKWSFDLIATEIPLDRSCSDARIPLPLCPCMNERTDMGFSFDIGLSEKADEEN